MSYFQLNSNQKKITLLKERNATNELQVINNAVDNHWDNENLVRYILRIHINNKWTAMRSLGYNCILSQCCFCLTTPSIYQSESERFATPYGIDNLLRYARWIHSYVPGVWITGFLLNSMLVNKDFLTWLLIGWRLCCQPIRCQLFETLC